MCRSVSCVDKAPDPSYLPCEERWTECSRWRFAVRSSCCHSDSDSLCDSRWSLVMKTYGSTLCMRVHNAREYTMHESTQCMRVHSAVPTGPRAHERRLLLKAAAGCFRSCSSTSSTTDDQRVARWWAGAAHPGINRMKGTCKELCLVAWDGQWSWEACP